MSEGDAAIVAVAQTQIGNEGGLKYCEWYGYPYRVEWCAIFVSWCADQCGYLDAGILPKELNVIPYVEWFRQRDQWQYRDYEPSPGDLIFYDLESDGLADHVGIVERVEDGVIYSIEGNAGDLCIGTVIPSARLLYTVLAYPHIDKGEMRFAMKHISPIVFLIRLNHLQSLIELL